MAQRNPRFPRADKRSIPWERAPSHALLSECESVLSGNLDLEAEESFSKQIWELEAELELSRAKAAELLDEITKRDEAFSEILQSIGLAKECLQRGCGRIGENELDGNEMDSEEPDVLDSLDVLMRESRLVYKLGMEVERKVAEYDEKRRKEIAELENSIASLMQENWDMGSLMMAAVAEKEAMERNLSRTRGEQKRGAIIQIAERGLQRVGFGFIMGVMVGESQQDQLGSSSASTGSDGSECEEEVTSLASTVQNIIKNLRLEITKLKLSLEESRSDCERLQSLVNQQAQKITENTQYIKDLEERENMLVHNVGELMLEIKEAGGEIVRWREACELEVVAGKASIVRCEEEVGELMLEIKEAGGEIVRWREACELEVVAGKASIVRCEEEAVMLSKELERTKAALIESNDKLKLKDKLAATAMAAQAVAETSLQLADSRSASHREQIEELMKQIEEEADRSRKERSGGRRKLRHVCWPWRALRLTPNAGASGFVAASWNGNRRKMLPEMEELMHIHI